MKRTTTLPYVLLSIILCIHIGYAPKVVKSKPLERKEIKAAKITPPIIKEVPTLQVDVTVYYPEAAQTDSSPYITADNSRINPKNPKAHRWVALSRDLLKRWGGQFDYGDTIYVDNLHSELDGHYIVKDCMASRWKNRIDILVGAKDGIYNKWANVIVFTENPNKNEKPFLL